jgi:hypothetical protein
MRMRSEVLKQRCRPVLRGRYGNRLNLKERPKRIGRRRERQKRRDVIQP